MHSGQQLPPSSRSTTMQSVGLASCAVGTATNTLSWDQGTASVSAPPSTASLTTDSPYSTAASPAMSIGTNSSPSTPMSHAPPSNASMGDMSQQAFCDKMCLVCGDEALGRHFGVLTCEACKSFFRRSVRQAAQYFCRYNRNCAIQKNSRNKCQYCRYQKCVNVGMQIEAVQDVRTPIKPRVDGAPLGSLQHTTVASVSPQYYQQAPQFMFPNATQWGQAPLQTTTMPNAGVPLPQQQPQPQPVAVSPQAGAVQMLEQPSTAIALQQQQPQQPQQQQVAVSAMNVTRIISLPMLLQAERAWPCEQPVKIDNSTNPGNFDDVIKSTKDQLYYAIEWAKMVPPFTELPIEDMVIVLKCVWNELLTLRLAFRPSPVEDALVLGTGKLLFRNKGDPEMMRIVGRFLDEIVTPCKMMSLEMAELVCMKALVLFNPDCPKLGNRHRVERIQEQCMEMLADYCRARFPMQKLRFSKILLRLSAVRSITTETRDYLVQRKTKGNISIDSFVLEMLGET